eukprot:TRINITY_DN9463_c0_g2_i1.p1 TRINITY_DN9463_c0_g2~~TRINITY_DN9463_c0_g2_i1.p1  ORF type:complete len:261 (+),score=75.27 TRINITY_DN9463_c0_g2_i1:28-810(+)
MSEPSAVYRYVVDDVIKNIKNEFISEGIDEEVLHELQQLWEQKLGDSGAVPAFSGFTGAPSEDLSSYQGYPHMYPYLNAPAATVQYNTTRYSQDNHAQTDHHYTDLPPTAVPLGKPQQYMPLQEWKQQGQATDVGGYAAGGNTTRKTTIPSMNAKHIPQLDGGDDDEDDSDEDDDDSDEDDEDESDEEEEEDEKKDDEDDELGSDLDISEDEPDTENNVLCQFEKVKRIKNKRRCNLKAGVIHLNGRDYLFNKANGEFSW